MAAADGMRLVHGVVVLPSGVAHTTAKMRGHQPLHVVGVQGRVCLLLRCRVVHREELHLTVRPMSGVAAEGQSSAKQQSRRSAIRRVSGHHHGGWPGVSRVICGRVRRTHLHAIDELAAGAPDQVDELATAHGTANVGGVEVGVRHLEGQR